MAELFKEITRTVPSIRISARKIDDGGKVCAIDFDMKTTDFEQESYEVILDQDETEALFDQLGDIINHDLRRF